MKQLAKKQVLLMAHGWGYNHHFFDSFITTLPVELQQTTVIACVEAGYFPDQAEAGLVIHDQGKWTHQPAETLHSLVLAHADLPWLGLGHSLGFSRLLEHSLRWHSLFSLHGFTRFTSSNQQPEGTAPRVLTRMVQKAEKNMAEVLGDFHARCEHTSHWAAMNETRLLNDLRNMQQLDCSSALGKALEQGTGFHAWAGIPDQIVPLTLAEACFNKLLSAQGHTLLALHAEHAGFASQPTRYTDTLLPLLCQR